jgi:hypothetical protein
LIYFQLSILNRQTKFQSSLNDFAIQMRSVKAKRILKRAKYIILEPTSVVFNGTIDDSTGPETSVDDYEIKKQTFFFDLQDTKLNLSPQMLSTSIKMANSIQTSINNVK